MADRVEYAPGEHEATLAYLDAMHHETREQTIARLEAALKVAKASPSAHTSPLATRTENVTREVTVGAPEPKPAKAKAVKRSRKAKKAKAEPVNKQVLTANAAE